MKTKTNAADWNAANPIGTKVLYWPVLPPMDAYPPVETETRSEAWDLASKHSIVLVKGIAGGVHLGHLKVIP